MTNRLRLSRPGETQYTTTEGGRRITVARKQRLDVQERRRTDGPTAYNFYRNANAQTVHVGRVSWHGRALCGASLGSEPVPVDPPDKLEACCLKCVTSGYHMPVLPASRA